MRPTRTDEEFKKASKHVLYEYQMLRSLAHAMASGICSNGWLHNALLESYLMHFRVLHEFFYPNTKNLSKDDIIADDFILNHDAWNAARPSSGDSLAQAYRKIHKRLAHLSYERVEVSPAEEPWQVWQLYTGVKRLTEAFKRNAAAARLDEAWESGLDADVGDLTRASSGRRRRLDASTASW